MLSANGPSRARSLLPAAGRGAAAGLVGAAVMTAVYSVTTGLIAELWIPAPLQTRRGPRSH